MVYFWHRICPGLYRIGNIYVEKIWHSKGACKGSHMWHVIVDGRTLVKWAYLRDAKRAAHKLV